MEISGDVTDAGRTDKRRTREDRATQPMDAGWLSFAKSRFDVRKKRTKLPELGGGGLANSVAQLAQK